jgi:hypothetical protein
MSDELDSRDALELPPTEASERYQAIWDKARQQQFDAPALRLFSDDDLIYLSGHRLWEEARSDHLNAGNAQAVDRQMQAFQHRARGNAIRAKDELDRRWNAAEIDALKMSNEAVVEATQATQALARYTRWMAIATIVLALVAVVALVVS